jgi:hypothetical protein
MHDRPSPWMHAALACLAFGCDAREPEPGLGAQTPAIINGQNEDGNPAVGALVVGGNGGLQSFCTGALIRPNWVLTAAHCLESVDPSYSGFFVGANVRSGGEAFRAGEFHIHPRYALNPAAALHDIALMKLAEPVPAELATPIEYNQEPLEAAVGEQVTFIGYGVSDGLSRTGGGQKRRTSVAISRVDPLTYSTGFAGSGVCFGDSGGPGLLSLSQGERVISVNSTVNGCLGDDCDPCQGTGSNYTRVDVFADWIAATLGEPFEHCTANVSLCDCPAACGADGVCDNALCPTESCTTALDCILDHCDGGEDGSCAQACVQGTTLGAQHRLGALIDCAAMRCEEVEGAAETRACLATQCAGELGVCNETAGQGSCADAAQCTRACAGEAACASACAEAATIDAQAALEAIENCRTTQCASATGEALDACLAAACPRAYDGCFPPDHCELEAASCPVGRVCAATPTGSTACAEQPDEPETEPDAGPGDGDGDSSGDEAGQDDESDSDEPTTTHEDPSSADAARGKSKGGCNVRAGQDSPRAGLATLLCLAGLTVVRRRGRRR